MGDCFGFDLLGVFASFRHFACVFVVLVSLFVVASCAMLLVWGDLFA